jgi:hypothetical protein
VSTSGIWTPIEATSRAALPPDGERSPHLPYTLRIRAFCLGSNIIRSSGIVQLSARCSPVRRSDVPPCAAERN